MKCKYCGSEMIKDDYDYTCSNCESYHCPITNIWRGCCSMCGDEHDKVYKQENEIYCEDCIKEHNSIKESVTIYYYHDGYEASGDENLDDMIKSNFADIEVIE